MKPRATGLKRIIDAFGYSMQGLKATVINESAFRQELFLFVVLFPLGIWLGDNALERVALVGSLFIVLITELLNSALEAAIDRIGQEAHELSGRAKDIGSAAVFVSLALVVVVWALFLWEKLGRL